MHDVKIGDFIRSSDPAKSKSVEKRLEIQQKEEPVVTKSDDGPNNEINADSFNQSKEEQIARQQASLFDDIKDVITPIEDYRKYLKDLGISPEEAAIIVDNLSCKKKHDETFPISKKVSIVLRTRTGSDTIRLQNALDAAQAFHPSRVQEIVARYNIAASLQRYNNDVFKFVDDPNVRGSEEDLFDLRLKYVKELPEAIIGKISIKLALFDRKVTAVMREGVAENF